MKFLMTICAITTALFCNATESMSDLRIAVDPFDAKNRSHIDFVSQTAFDMGPFNFLINPEIAFYLNRSVDFGISLGHRWPVGLGAIGHHVFFDRSQMPSISVNQFGTGIDWLTPKLDLRANYYHPISPAVQMKDRMVKPCKWIEAEGVLKNRYFNIAAGPTFNLDSKVAGAQARFIIPFERFSLGIGGCMDQIGRREAFLITNFHLYRDKGSDYSNIPASHNKRPKIEHTPLPTPKPKKQNQQAKQQEKPAEPPEKTQESVVQEDDEDNSWQTSVEEQRKYWEERQKREREENAKETQSVPLVPIQPNEKSIWENIKGFFLGK